MIKLTKSLLALGIGAVGLFLTMGGVVEAAPSLPDEKSILLDVDLDRDLHGRVLNSQGKPLAGATLQLVRLKWRGRSLDLKRADFEASRESFATNALGEFKIPLKHNKQYHLMASYGKLATQEITSLYAGAFVEITLQQTAQFAGSVLRDSDSSPIAGAMVRGWTTGGRAVEIFSGETDSDGRFHFEALPPGPIRVEVVPEKHATPPTYFVKLVSAKQTHYEFRCSDGFRVYGKITDKKTGAPIHGARVGQGSAFLKSVRTNADGQYEILSFSTASEKGHGELFVEAPRFGYHSQFVATNSGQKEMNFKLEPSRRVSGRVFHPNGEPASGSNIVAITAAEPRQPDILNWYTGQVSADGSFVIEGLSWGGHYAIFVRSENYANVVYELPPRAKRALSFKLNPIHLMPAASLRGIVRNKDGTPAPGLWVRFGDKNQNAESRFRYAEEAESVYGHQTVNENYTQRGSRTDHLGRFTFVNLIPGIGFLEVFKAEDYEASSWARNAIMVKKIVIKKAQDMSGIELVLPQ